MIIKITYKGREYSLDLPCTIEEVTEFVLSGGNISFRNIDHDDIPYSEFCYIVEQLIYKWLLSNPWLIENYCYTTGEDHFLFRINKNSSFLMATNMDGNFQRVLQMITNKVKYYNW